jgi:hypothetical protein
MTRALACWSAFVLVLSAGQVEAREWRCGATASFSDGAVGVYLLADDHGKLKRSGTAVAEYMPGPSPSRLPLTFVYLASVDANQLIPGNVQSTLRIKRDAAGGRVVLTVGAAKANWTIPSTAFTGTGDYTMWIDLPVDKAMADALTAGGPGQFSIQEWTD